MSSFGTGSGLQPPHRAGGADDLEQVGGARRCVGVVGHAVLRLKIEVLPIGYRAADTLDVGDRFRDLRPTVIAGFLEGIPYELLTGSGSISEILNSQRITLTM
jgi:hypothetical protein